MATGKKFAELMGLTETIEPGRGARRPSEPRTAPGQMINAFTGRDEALARAEIAEAELEALKAGLLIDLTRLTEKKGRRRNLSDVEFQELKANIRKHGLITPITVRPDGDGFEIVSGHNRVRVYRELALEDAEQYGRIKAYVDAQSEESKAEELAFYANLLHPDLPDYEKYVGLKRIQQANTNLTTARALSEHVGIGEQQVGRLLKIGDLPPDAVALVAENPKAFGASALAQFASLSADGHKERVIEAMLAVVRDGLDQSKAVELVKAVPKEKTGTPGPKTESVTIKGAGNKKYCSLRAVKNVLRIEFADEADLAEVQDALRELLAHRAHTRKGEGD